MSEVPPAPFASVDDLLADARSRLRRLTPAQAHREVQGGARLVDIRPAWQRADEGEIPGSLIVERNHLEWRLHPASPDRVPAAGATTRWIVVCSQSYTSSLAAAALISLGLDATDLAGGFQAWQAAGLPTTIGPTRTEQIVGEQPPACEIGDTAPLR